MVDPRQDLPGSASSDGLENVVTSQRFVALQEELALRSRMQTAVAELGQASLTLVDADLLTAQACGLVVDTLGVELARVLEYVEEEGELVTRAVVGASNLSSWSQLVDSEALHAFHSDQAVVFSDLKSETRFDGKPLLSSCSISSGISVRLNGRHEPFGVLGAYSTSERVFRKFEVEFLQSIGNVLAAAIERKRASQELAETRSQIAHRERIASIGSWTWSRGERDWKWSEEVYRLLDTHSGELTAEYASFLKHVHSDDRGAFAAMIERAFASEGEHTLEHRVMRKDGGSRIVRTVVQGIFGGSGKAMRLIGTTQDITDIATSTREKVRLNAMIELAAQEWRLTCDALDAMLLVVDRNGTVLRLNERARALIHLPFQDAVGATIPSDQKGEPWATVRELVTVSSETQMSSTAVAIDSATNRQWQISARSLRHEALGDERVVVVIEDVSDASVQEQVRRDVEVLEGITHLISSLSLRAGRPVSALTELLSQEIGAMQLTAAQMKTARAATYDLSRLFHNLTEYAEPFTLSLHPLQLRDVLDDAIGAIAPAAIARGIKLEAELISGRELLGHSPHLSQLFSSLLRLFIDRSEARDTLRLRLEETTTDGRTFLCVSIESPRPIFTSAELRWIVDPRLPRIDDDAATRLSINHRIVQEHGGDMLLENRGDTSAIASFRFPVFSPARR
jgi:PAS domain S-box-containing protein